MAPFIAAWSRTKDTVWTVTAGAYTGSRGQTPQERGLQRPWNSVLTDAQSGTWGGPAVPDCHCTQTVTSLNWRVLSVKYMWISKTLTKKKNAEYLSNFFKWAYVQIFYNKHIIKINFIFYLNVATR